MFTRPMLLMIDDGTYVRWYFQPSYFSLEPFQVGFLVLLIPMLMATTPLEDRNYKSLPDAED